METINFSPKKTATGMLLVAIALTLSSVAGVATLYYTLSQPLVDRLVTGATPTWMTVLSCLSQLGSLAQIVGIIMIAIESKKISREHTRTAWLGLVLYFLALVASLAGGIPLTMYVSTQGSLPHAVAAAWLTAACGVLMMLGMGLMAVNMFQNTKWPVLITVLASGAISLAGVAFSTVGMKLHKMELMGQTMYLTLPNMDGLYPLFLIAGVAASWILVLLFWYIHSMVVKIVKANEIYQAAA